LTIKIESSWRLCRTSRCLVTGKRQNPGMIRDNLLGAKSSLTMGWMTLSRRVNDTDTVRGSVFPDFKISLRADQETNNFCETYSITNKI
jgi:hypothetical protein